MSDKPHQLEFALRKLRHLYEQMVNGHLRPNQENHARIANGLLSPAIADIERHIAKTSPHACVNDNYEVGSGQRCPVCE